MLYLYTLGIQETTMSSPAQATPRYVSPAESDTLRMERRFWSRHVITGRVTAVRSDPHLGDDHKCICPLELLNISDGGLGAVVQEPVAPDSKITVFFPPHGPERGMDLCGEGVRCSPCDQRHEIGIRFNKRYAA